MSFTVFHTSHCFVCIMPLISATKLQARMWIGKCLEATFIFVTRCAPLFASWYIDQFGRCLQHHTNKKRHTSRISDMKWAYYCVISLNCSCSFERFFTLELPLSIWRRQSFLNLQFRSRSLHIVTHLVRVEDYHSSGLLFGLFKPITRFFFE